MSDCPLCAPQGEHVLWHEPRLRVIQADDRDYPGFCRVVWNRHVREMTDLAPADRDLLLAAVYVVEGALRELLSPTKINLASLGNQVPHLHWHVVPRFEDDAHFPDAIWGARRRPGGTRNVDSRALAAALKARLSAGACGS